MAETTEISWTHSTFNGWWGCTKVGPGCDHCYAETLDKRTGGAHWGVGAERRRTSEKNWREPLKWNKAAQASGKPWRVFCSSMADVFDNAVPDLWRRDLAQLIRDTPHLTWMLLTKRIGNARDMLVEMFPGGCPSNVWLGATIVNQMEADRDGPKLKATKEYIGIRRVFLSIEPMLGAIDLSAFAGWLDWVICGGESGHGARPAHPNWFRALRDWCAANAVAFFFKQWGEWDADALYFTDMEGRCPPPKMRIGKKAAGDLLDGVRHHNWPEAA